MASTRSATRDIERSIVLVRGQRVVIDSEIAALYGTPTKVLLQSVRRNLERFPPDFMFQLTNQEVARLRSQIVTSKQNNHGGQGGRRYAVHAFTEQGVAMLSSVLRSPTAIAINIEIMRAFVRLRRTIAENEELARQLAALERRLATHDRAIFEIFETIRKLMTPPRTGTPRRIGFV
jgi:hypothetical protein